MRVEQLNKKRHARDAFCCGRDVLDDWFRLYAAQAQKNGTAQTYVLIEGDEPPDVVGYYSLTSHSIELELVPERLRRGQLQVVPAVLLARLAIDKAYQSRGLGARLLADAARRVVAISESVGVAVWVVDALDDQAASFYERYGFQRWPADHLRLFMRIGDLAKTFETS